MGPLYTRSYREDILRAIDNGGRQITAEEHAFASEQQYGAAFVDKDSLLRATLCQWHLDLDMVGKIRDLISQYQHKVVVSFGAGTCALEYLVELGTSQDVKIIATDFDAFFIARAQELLPEITALKFDMMTGDITSLEARVGGRIDVALLCNASPVLSDSEFINFFSQLRRSSCKMLLHFSGGLPWWYFITDAGLRLRTNKYIRQLFRKPPLPPEIGKLHAYSRTRSELKKLYAASGWRVKSQFTCGQHPFCLVLV